MTLASLRHLVQGRRSLGWLLAVLLWLPVAQWAAAAHPLLHLGTAAAEHEPAAAHLPGSCELCVLAAAIGGAAPQSAPADAPLPRLPQARPQARVGAGAARVSQAPYHSRAPPSLHA